MLASTGRNSGLLIRGGRGGKSGGVHCGQLQVIAVGEPEQVYVCHYKACQRRTGAVAHSGSRWLKTQVRVEGQHKVYGRPADSGSRSASTSAQIAAPAYSGKATAIPTTAGSQSAALPTPLFLHRLRRDMRSQCIPGLGCRPEPSVFSRRGRLGVDGRHEHDKGDRVRFLILGAGGLGGYYGGLLLKGGADVAFSRESRTSGPARRPHASRQEPGGRFRPPGQDAAHRRGQWPLRSRSAGLQGLRSRQRDALLARDRRLQASKEAVAAISARRSSDRIFNFGEKVLPETRCDINIDKSPTQLSVSTGVSVRHPSAGLDRRSAESFGVGSSAR